jgi:protein farnesyltransferase/geranylgeranyltransferase type-1 subunit alpha
LEKCRQEADFALEGAELDPYNESPFRYLIGLFREQSTNISSLSAEYYPKVEALGTKLEEAQRDPMSCVNWTSARIDLLEGIGNESSLTQAISLATEMADQYDTIRKKYWMLRVVQLKEKLPASA